MRGTASRFDRSTRLSILVLNTGSSSLKFSLFDDEAVEVSVDGEVDWRGPDQGAELVIRQAGQPDRRSRTDASDPAAAATLAIRSAREALGPGSRLAAIGHRIVHGGTRFLESVRIDPAFESQLDHLAELAPLHNPPALKAIEAARSEEPDIPQVAAFDTSFFAHLPDSAAIYPTPWAWHEDHGIRRFGFHGLSHAYCSQEAAKILNREPSSLKLVICHLGNGASAAAVRNGKAVGTTMGFTPLAGLMMGTRSGEVDPGILLYLMKEKGLTADDLDDALNHRSGLLGVSGVSSDYRQVEEAAKAGNARAKLALEIYAARVRSAIGALAATLGGLDAVVFAGGVGENSATLRVAACEGLEFLGVRLDAARNTAHPRDADIAEADSPSRVLVVHTREDLMIAREVRRLVPDA
jgi:acetate kinase